MPKAFAVLDYHDGVHFRQALRLAKEARGITGNAVDDLCHLPTGMTNAIVRGDRNIYPRDVLRYCEKLDIPPDKPWGVAVCSLCEPPSHDRPGVPEGTGDEFLLMHEQFVCHWTAVEQAMHTLMAALEIPRAQALAQQPPTGTETLYLLEAMADLWIALAPEDRVRFVAERLTGAEWHALTGRKEPPCPTP